MALLICPFVADHREGVIALYTAAWHAAYDAIDGAASIDAVIAAQLSGPNPQMFDLADGDQALVAIDCDTIVGGIRGHPRGSALHLSGFYVLPNRQRSGVGSALLADLIGRFPACTEICADVRPQSQAARQFYARNQFVERNRSRDDVGGGYHVDVISLQRIMAQQAGLA